MRPQNVIHQLILILCVGAAVKTAIATEAALRTHGTHSPAAAQTPSLQWMAWHYPWRCLLRFTRSCPLCVPLLLGALPAPTRLYLAACTLHCAFVVPSRGAPAIMKLHMHGVCGCAWSSMGFVGVHGGDWVSGLWHMVQVAPREQTPATAQRCHVPRYRHPHIAPNPYHAPALGMY
jgi:hypothetical protein